VGARSASGFALPVGSEVFEESGRSLVRGTLDYLQGLKVCHFSLIYPFIVEHMNYVMPFTFLDAWSQAN
jgi:hypothetical protein